MNKPLNFKEYDTLKGVLPHDDVLSQCIHCGMCLAACPTYNVTKMERSSPRGRIKLIKSVAHGKLPLTHKFAEEMDFCLDCQACETACPAGVKYGQMVEAARVEVTNAKLEPWFKRTAKKVGLNTVLANKTILKLVARLFFVYQRLGIQWLIQKSGILRLMGKNMPEIEQLLPPMAKKFSSSVLKKEIPSKTEKKYRVAFLTGCLMDVAFADINLDTVEVLLQNGCEIVVPEGQECCGSLHAHYGEQGKALDLAKINLDAFSKYEYDYLVCNSAGCTAFMKEYAHLFANDPKYGEKAKKFSAKVKDITEFLNETGLNTDMREITDSVTYHDACHLAHTQKIVTQPRNVLEQIPGVSLIPLKDSTTCCGSGGIYNVVRYDDSMKFLENKMKNIEDTKAKIVVTGNPGCMAQIQYGAKKRKMDIEVIHPATLLKRAYDKE